MDRRRLRVSLFAGRIVKLLAKLLDKSGLVLERLPLVLERFALLLELCSEKPPEPALP